MTKNQKRFLWMAGLSLFCLVGCGKKTTEFISSEEVKNSSSENRENESAREQKEICVYVCGQVEVPGVYHLLEGDRIDDLFVMAGGLTEKAAMDYWNRARVLADGEMIYVPTQEEVENRDLPISGAGEVADPEKTKVNINTATKEELMTLPGIGESKAVAILSYREEHGKFSSIEEITKVPGIKEALLKKIKEYIRIN